MGLNIIPYICIIIDIMKYSKELIKECADWVRENGLMDYGGASLMDFCAHFHIDNKSYYRWMKITEFAEAIKKAKEDFKNSLEKDLVESLSRAAKGYEYEQTTSEYGYVDGKKVLRKHTKKNVRVEPNVGANIFLLTNLAPERWKNRQDNNVDVSGGLQGSIEIKLVGDDSVGISGSEAEIMDKEGITEE